MLRNCLHQNEIVIQVHNIQGPETMGQVARAIPRIYAAVEDLVEVEGKIPKQSVSILIEPGSTHSYITPKIVEICAFKKLKHRKSWLVQLATRIKRKVSEVV